MICAVNQDAEESFKKTLEVDRLIDALNSADDKEVGRTDFMRLGKMVFNLLGLLAETQEF